MLNIALAQCDLTLGDRTANLATVDRMAGLAAAAGAHLLVLPELWATGYALDHANELADEIDTGVFTATSDLAKRHKLAICGSLLERRPTGIYNTATLYDAHGQRCATYSKIHLIGLMDEDRYLTAGEQLGLGDWESTTAGLAICYDLRFPELFRQYVFAGVKLLLVPAEWPTKRIEHWRVLLQARAIENQCIVAACNRVGSDHANTFGGHSMLIDAWGNVVIEGDDHAEVLIGSVDLDGIDDIRTAMPVLKDARLIDRQPVSTTADHQH